MITGIKNTIVEIILNFLEIELILKMFVYV